ncbi:hypothetical protein BHU72_02425 [Desulfuribacillus stibiiarsenatis]|uniref:Uncharacterized protein n=1 Tax=Desulfuribacillus stibiiarsenatis TaxID=1390249 RepID=A0A1E5L688_9FIRM|nr:hypothetical protein [Desulfuribacillus stibiiarsenatis]OEH85672.1 hypothetical protein BHU72_02425 [Desulfuribacillus stibiiarsenatis]
MRFEDFLVLGIIFLIVLYNINKGKNKITYSNIPKSGEALKLLQDEGYEVISGKIRVPLDIKSDGKDYQSRLLVDFIVNKDDRQYVVKIKNKRKQERLSGSFLRDELLKYQLAFGADGVIYVDVEKQKLQSVSFAFEYSKSSMLSYFKLPKWMFVSIALAIVFLILR